MRDLIYCDEVSRDIEQCGFKSIVVFIKIFPVCIESVLININILYSNSESLKWDDLVASIFIIQTLTESVPWEGGGEGGGSPAKR